MGQQNRLAQRQQKNPAYHFARPNTFFPRRPRHANPMLACYGMAVVADPGPASAEAGYFGEIGTSGICFGVGFHADAGADKVAIAVDVIHATDGRPEFVLAHKLRRKGGEFA